MKHIFHTIQHAARTATVLLLALLAAQTAGAQGNVSDADGLAAALNDTNVGVINVTADITGVGGLSLYHDLTINLNGHTISGNGLNFNVGPGRSLTIYGGGGNIISGKADVPAIYNRGTVTLSNVNIITYPDHAINGGGTLNIGNNVSFKYISDIDNASGLETALNDTNVGVINVTADITGVGACSLDQALTINLNGHTISGDELYFDVGPGHSLTINGGGQDGSVGNIIRGKADQPAINNGGTVTLSHVNIITYPGQAINGDGTLNIGDNVSFKYISDIDNAGGLVAAFNDPNVGVINVTDDITGVGNLFLNRDLTINLNGHTISGDGLFINVDPGRSLTINEEGQDGSVGNIISGYANQPAIQNNGGTVTLSHVNITTNSGFAIFAPGTLNIGNNVSFNGWTQAPFNTPNVNTEDGNYNYAPGNPLANVVATVTVGGVTRYFENSGAALAYIVSHPDNDHFSLSGTTYTIHTATGWDAFCYLLANSDKGFFTGKTVRLGADIGTADDPVTIMAGVSQHDFTGTFDGDGHTLTVGYGTADAPFGEQYAAPFRNAENGCVVENLHVAGTIATSAQNAAGIIGNQFGTVTIRNCRVSVTISSSKSGDGTHGGLVAVKGNSNSAHLTIEGCVFDGKIVSTGTGDDATTNCGGFVGWRKDNGSLTITNCLYAPTADDNAVTVGATFARNGGSITNCYYTRTLGDAQGKALHSVTAGDDVTLALSGTATEYTVSGITAYEGNQGIKYGTTYYAGSGDVVSLTLSNTAPAAPDGYQYGYTASAGTLIGSTLTMPAEDVTVSPALRSTHAAVPVTYVDADGNTVSDQTAIALDGTETSLGKSNQETWYFVGLTTVAFDHRLNLNGIVHLILADGCTMNVTSNADGIAVNGSLTIYGQTDGTGTLNATSGDGDGISTHIGNLTISGGRVTVTGDKGFGIITNGGNLTISGGRVTVTGGNAGIHTDSGNITISGGRVTATGGNGGILFNSGTITLGCTTASDFIYVSSYGVGSGGSLNIVGQKLYDEDGNSYSGTIIDYADLDGKTLRLSPGIALTARQAPDGNYWTTYYNGTRGFTIDEDENACAYTATYGDGKLTLHKLGKQIPYGTAVIIVADNDEVSMATATDLDDFTGDNDLSGVNTDTPTSTLGTGTFYVLGMTTVDNEQHFGFHRYTGSMMAAHKAFVLVSGSQALARSLTMVFDDATGVESLTPDAAPNAQAAQHWFTLDGRRLQAKPTAPGIYINNGKKVVIK